MCVHTHMHIASFTEELHHHYPFRGTDSKKSETEGTSLLHGVQYAIPCSDFLHYIPFYLSILG